jgi:hypothetical protein
VRKKKTSKERKVEKWLAIRKKAGRKIDPKTAKVMYSYAQVMDPYGVHPDLPREHQCVGRDYFARSLLEATFGFGSATSLERPKTLCGKNTNQSWRFRLDFRQNFLKSELYAGRPSVSPSTRKAHRPAGQHRHRRGRLTISP